jgi:hypothetical protein
LVWKIPIRGIPWETYKPMKTIFTILLNVHLVLAFAQMREIKTEARIKEVTVFLKGAQVTRTATVDVPAGTSLIVLSGTSASISEESIQAETGDNLKIVGVAFRVNHMEELSTSIQVESLQSSREKLKSQIAHEQSSLTIYEQEETMLNANKVIGGNQSGLDVAALKVAVGYYRERMKEIRDLKQECRGKLLEWGADVARIESQLAELKAAKPQPQGEIVVKVVTKAPARASLKVAYLVQEASWFPRYDIRAKDIQSPIAITYKANVSQQSGEDWKNVMLTISSGNPSLTGARPIIQPWHLGFNNHVQGVGSENTPIRIRGMSSIPGYSPGEVTGRVLDEDGIPIPGVNVLIKGTSIGTTTDADGMYRIYAGNSESIVFSFIGYASREVPVSGRSWIDATLNLDVTQLSETVVIGTGAATGYLFGSSAPVRTRRIIAATPVVRQTDFEFHIDHPYTIQSNGETETVEMVEYELDAAFQYYCVPKIEKDAFLTARVTGWDEYNFLEGEASLFFEGKYLGKTILDTRNTLDTLTISLGRDRNVVVEREKIKDVSSSLLIGSNRKNVFAYEITLRNKKAEAINIRIEDQYPVPNTKEITVDEVENSGAALNKETGLMTWDLKLSPGKTEKLELKYVVRYPKYANLILE